MDYKLPLHGYLSYPKLIMRSMNMHGIHPRQN